MKCPYCGKEIPETVKSVNTGIMSQTGLYLVSFFLPPFGIGWTIKYLKSTDDKAKKIGIASVILTIAGLAAAVMLVAGSISQLSSQMQQYSALGI